MDHSKCRVSHSFVTRIWATEITCHRCRVVWRSCVMCWPRPRSCCITSQICFLSCSILYFRFFPHIKPMKQLDNISFSSNANQISWLSPFRSYNSSQYGEDSWWTEQPVSRRSTPSSSEVSAKCKHQLPFQATHIKKNHIAGDKPLKDQERHIFLNVWSNIASICHVVVEDPVKKIKEGQLEVGTNQKNVDLFQFTIHQLLINQE